MSNTIIKTILVLANSIKKHPDRCIAGLEMTQVDGGYRFGQWVRPIDQSKPEGAIPYQRMLIGSKPVCPLQCVEMSFDGPANDPNHPEDWILTPGSKWTVVGQYDHSVFQPIPDEAGDLWGLVSVPKRRILTGTARNTLKLVKPEGPVLVEAFHDFNSFTQRNQFRKYLTIPCRGVRHQFSITDPLFEYRHGVSPGNVKKNETLRFELAPENLVVVVSLTPPLGEYQYKIAAAIIES